MSDGHEGVVDAGGGGVASPALTGSDQVSSQGLPPMEIISPGSLRQTTPAWIRDRGRVEPRPAITASISLSDSANPG
jgi:hypothetical protein